jgi:serine phosphatase RsbU (regulator of sigma subunit)
MLGLGVAKKKAAPDASATARCGSGVEMPGAAFAYEQRASEAGCDAVHFQRAGEGRLVFMLLDVAGARATGTPVVNAAAATFMEHSSELFSPADLNAAEALSELAMKLNRAVMVEGRVRCAAAFLACFDGHSGALWYVNAGHSPALIHDSGYTELSATGVPFGLFSHAIHDAQVTVMNSQSAFVLASKGTIEMGGRGREFGLAGVGQASDQAGANAEQLCTAVLDAAERIAGPRNLHRHDRTVVSLVRA